MAEPTEADKAKAFEMISEHCGQCMDLADYAALEASIAAALAAERERTWERAIGIAANTWAVTSVGKVKIEHQAEYERFAIVEALKAAKEEKQ